MSLRDKYTNEEWDNLEKETSKKNFEPGFTIQNQIKNSENIETDKINYIERIFNDLKNQRKIIRDKIPYSKMNKRDEYHVLMGKISILGKIMMFLKYGYSIEDIENLRY